MGRKISGVLLLLSVLIFFSGCTERAMQIASLSGMKDPLSDLKITNSSSGEIIANDNDTIPFELSCSGNVLSVELYKVGTQTWESAFDTSVCQGLVGGRGSITVPAQDLVGTTVPSSPGDQRSDFLIRWKVKDMTGEQASLTYTRTMTAVFKAPAMATQALAAINFGNYQSYPVNGSCSTSGHVSIYGFNGTTPTQTSCSGGAFQASFVSSAPDGQIPVTTKSYSTSGRAYSQESFSVLKDTSRPTVNMSSSSQSSVRTAFDVGIVFSEPVADFKVSDFTLSNATLENFTGSGASYSVRVVPTAQGTVTIGLSAGKVKDLAGNTNGVPGLVSRTYDTVKPTLTLVSPADTVTALQRTITVNSSESVSLLSQHFSLVNASVVGVSGSGSSFYVTIQAQAAGMVQVKIPVDALADAAGNTNEASNILNYEYVPALTLTSITPTSGSMFGGTQITLTGTNFIDSVSDVLTVKVGGNLCTELTKISSTSATCITPVGTVGAKEVVVQNHASNVATLASAFTYKEELPLISLGSSHSCAITANQNLKCWGSNSYGQLGDTATTTNDYLTPVSPTLTSLTSVKSGLYHTCAIQSGAVKCWGRNDAQQLSGPTGSALMDIRTANIPNGPVKVLGVGAKHSCAINNVNNLYCWGDNTFIQLAITQPTVGDGPGTPTQTAIGAAAVYLGGYHTCYKKTSGAVLCVGRNANGQLGSNDLVDKTAFTSPVNLSDVKEMALGSAHTCAVLNSGAVKCWGLNNQGQLGLGHLLDQKAPIEISGLTEASSIVAGPSHTCALLSSGKVKCWGSNNNGQLGINSVSTYVNTPQDVLDGGVAMTGVKAIAVGGTETEAHTCAYMTNNTVKCWGGSSMGQLGNGTTIQKLVPTLVTGF